MEEVLIKFVLPVMKFISVIVVAGVISIILFHDPSGGDNGGY
jgi:hypothetical protein